MMHQQIENEEIIERYVRNRLKPEERTAFEEHYFSCDECFEKVQTAERFVAGMRDAARRGALSVSPHGAPMAWRLAPSWVPIFAVSTVALLLLAVGGVSWHLIQISTLRGQLNESVAQLQREQKARAKLAQQLQQALQAEGNIPLVILQSTRDVQAQPPEVILPVAATRLVLWVDLAKESFSSYRLDIYGAADESVETLHNLTRNAYGALAASVPTDRLQPGEFRIKLSAEARSRATPLAEYRLRIRRP